MVISNNMALKTTGDIITEVLVRNNRTTTDSFITDTMLQDWVVDAHQWASSYHKWPFTEGRVSTTWAASPELTFEGYKADSFRFVQVGGKRLQKMNFDNFQTLLEETPGSSDRVYSDFGRTLFFNTTADVSGTLVAYGQYQPVIDRTDLASNTVFTNWDDEGNEAIVEKVTGYLKRREHIPDEAELHDKRAVEKLEEVWGRVAQEQFAYHSQAGDGMFSRIDVVDGGRGTDQFKRNQF